MSAPFNHATMLSEFEQLINTAPAGPRLELGVCHGESLAIMAQHNHLTYGIDSFEGMGNPGPFDLHPDGRNEYPRGRLRADYSEVAQRFAKNPRVHLIKGWIPEALRFVPRLKYAFVHIDLDHYLPTTLSISWVWNFMAEGGVLCCDDWFPDSEMFASRAIREAIWRHRPLDGVISRKGYWRF